MLRLSLVLLCGVFLPSAGFAQADASGTSTAPRAASLCDLRHNPASYNGQWISVRAKVSMEFEDFTLHDPDCDARGLSDVWLTFGGDQNEIAVYCCPSGSRKKGVDIEIEGHRVPLVRDEALREFQRVLKVGRLRMPDGSRCGGNECRYYRSVQATITGMFFAGQDGATPGYGHLGCCHLLVIKQVSDVSAERTQVPAGGEFKCTRKTWNVSPVVAAGLNSQLACSGPKEGDCDQDLRIALSRIAAHWHDKVDVNGGHDDSESKMNGDFLGTWVSDDLLITYSTVAKKTSARLAVIRQVCVPLSGEPANAASDPISCQEYRRSWEDDAASTVREVEELFEGNKPDAANAKIAEASKSILSEGDQAWRLQNTPNVASHALKEQAQKWGVVPEMPLQRDKCDDASLPEQKDHLVGCSWYSGDGTQMFYVALQKPKSRKADPVGRDTPWVVTEIEATICH